MPLPRFGRLAPARQAEILRVARAHFAAEGPQTASYNKIIEASGLSKSAVYQYFDSREDLLGAVLDGVQARVLAALGEWRPAADPGEFWQQLDRGARGLRGHLAQHPDDLALVPALIARAGQVARPWFEALVADGRRLGVIRADVDTDLMLAATVATFRAADEWAVAALRDERQVDLDQPWLLLAGLWGTQPPSEGVS